MNEWIKVEESLPQSGRDVWVYYNIREGRKGKVFKGQYNGKTWYIIDLASKTCRVTHWMPIFMPEPPEGA